MSVRIMASIILPTHDNDGVAIPYQTTSAFGRRLIALSGGFTSMVVSGGWVHDGRLFTDTSVEYGVWLESWRQVPDFLKLADWARTACRQIAIAISIANVPEELH